MTCSNKLGNQEEINRQLKSRNTELTKSLEELSKRWCNLGPQNVIAKKVLSTKKSVILIDSDKTWREAYNICKSICGAMYFPSTRIENKEVAALVEKHGASWIWLRISDEEREGHWKDPDNKESLTFTN